MYRVLTSVSVILLLAAAPAFAQQGTTPDGRPMDPAGIQNKTPDGRPINPEGISSMKFTAQEEKAWFDKPVYSSDGTKIGNVAAFARGTDNSISEMHADIGGFLGSGRDSRPSDAGPVQAPRRPCRRGRDRGASQGSAESDEVAFAVWGVERAWLPAQPA